jgi:hypothetical protein
LYPGWSDNTNVGPPACEQYPNVDTLASLNTSRIVAIRASVFDNITREEICGREVRIYDASGNQVMLDEGAFYVWDRCSGCDSIPEHNYETRIDLSTKAYLQITGESCRNPAHGLRYEILPNKVRSWPWDGNPERN